MNNNDIIILKKENHNQINETNNNSQNKITEISPEKTSEKNISTKNEKEKNNNHLYKELLIEDNSAENNNSTESISEENGNNSSKKLKNINDLNDYYSSEEYNDITNRPKNIITVNDIIGEDIKKEIKLNIMDESFNNFYPGKVSTKSYGPIKAYAANTNQGIARDYNEDRVSIIININQPNNNNKEKEKIIWPKASYFSVFDGHGGNKCAEFLRDNLLKLICDNDYFPNDIEKAIKYGFSEADKLFLENAAKDGELIDNSGSCGLILLIVDNKIYIANVGDSRCIISMKNGLIKKDVTRDHKPNYPYEKERIVLNGGRIYQTQTPLNQNLENNGKNNEENNKNNLILLGPHRVFPGSLSVSRTIGDAAAKLTFLGGNPKVVISEPDIYCYDLDKDDIDFLILGCDGIYDQLTSQDVFKCAYMMIDYSKNYNLKVKNTNINDNKNDESIDEIDLYTTCANIVDFILKVSMSRKSFDNVTCLIIAFKDLLNDNANNKNKKDINDKNDKNDVKIEEKKEIEINDNKNEKKDINKEKSENNVDKNDEILPKLFNNKTNDLQTENNKNENNEKKNNLQKKKLVVDKIQIKSIQKEDKILNNKFNKNKHIELYSDNSESPNKKDINSGELSHRAINNNLLKEFKYKASRTGENDNNIHFTHKNKLTLSTTKMKKTKSKDLLTEKNYKNNNNLDKEKEKEIDNNNPINNINYNSNNKNLSIKKNRLNATKKYFLNKKIKPLYIENKLTTNNKYKYQNNFTLKITTFNSNNNNNNINHHTKTGSSLNKLISGFSDLNLYQNINLREKNPTVFSNNIPKITNINTIVLKNNKNNKLSLNDLLPISNGKNMINDNRNTIGIRLRSLNKKSISFYNNYAFNELINHNKVDKNIFQKNQQSHFDIFNINSNNGRNSYGNIKSKNAGNMKKNENPNKYHFSNEDKYKIRLGKPINICSVNSNNNILGKNQRFIGNDLKGKKLIHNLTEDLLSDNYRNEMPNINSKNKINNNITTVKKLNFI